MPRSKVKTQDLVAMYQQQLLSLRQIGLLVGMSGAAVHKRLKLAGVDTTKRVRVERNCAFCGEKLAIRRCHARGKINNYCNRECYFAAIENEGYKPWRQGGRLARAIVSRHFRLPRGSVVHHKDGDQRNNDLSNLAVFATQNEHTSFHRGGKGRPIWEGGE